MRSRFVGKSFATLTVVVLMAAPLWARDEARPYLGITAAAKQTEPAGVLIAQVRPNSPAAKAGLKKADRIVMAGDKEIKTFQDLTEALTDSNPGDKLTLRVVRKGKEQTITVTLGEAPTGEKTAPKGKVYLGAFVQSLTPQLKDHLRLDVEHGALVVQVLPDSPADRAGFMEEDVITKVGDVAVATSEELSDAIMQRGVGDEVELTVARGKKSIKLKARLQEAPKAGMFFADNLDWPERLEAFSDSPWSFFPGLQEKRALEKKVEDLEKRFHELEERITK